MVSFVSLYRTLFVQDRHVCCVNLTTPLYLLSRLRSDETTPLLPLCRSRGHFMMFSVITNTYNKKTRGPTLMELFTATGKLKKFVWQLEMFEVCTIATWPRWPLGTDHCSNEEYLCTHVDTCVARTWISYRCVPCHPWCTHRTSLVV
jgi:hypothetical protein